MTTNSKKLKTVIFHQLSDVFLKGEISFLSSAATIILSLNGESRLEYIVKFKFSEDEDYCSVSIFSRVKKENIDELNFFLGDNTSVEDLVEDMTAYINYIIG